MRYSASDGSGGERLLPRGTKIGHAGTLDPFATGVLLLLVGKSTRLCERLMDEPKQYEATVKLGATTPTEDPDSPETISPDAPQPSNEALREAIQSFQGTIRQRPPAFSALKVGGKRAYDLARRGREVSLEPREVRVDAIELLGYDWPFARLRIDCGRGTYIRAIARDLGAALGVGGYLTSLCRTRVGRFGLETAATLEQLSAENVAAQLDPAADLQPLPPGGNL